MIGTEPLLGVPGPPKLKQQQRAAINFTSKNSANAHLYILTILHIGKVSPNINLNLQKKMLF